MFDNDCGYFYEGTRFDAIQRFYDFELSFDFSYEMLDRSRTDLGLTSQQLDELYFMYRLWLETLDPLMCSGDTFDDFLVAISDLYG